MTRTEITFWALAAIILLSAFAILAAIANPARATDWDWSMSGDSYHSHRQKPRRKKTYTRRSYDNSYDRERVRGYRSVEQEDQDDFRICAPGPVRGLGTQWLAQDGAMDAARKDWMERTRYDLGESYLDLKNAKDFVSRCGRVSIGEAMGQSMMRCEIIARPCKGVFEDSKQATGK
jgi:hypothetical protein